MEGLFTYRNRFFFGASTYYYDSYLVSRVLMGVGLLLWIMIGYLFGSYAEMISSSISLLSLLTGLYRHYVGLPKVTRLTGALLILRKNR